jgi:hypothetical protein
VVIPHFRRDEQRRILNFATSCSLPPRPNLEDLLAQAEHFANHFMRNIGRLPPTLFLIGSKGPVMFMSGQMRKSDSVLPRAVTGFSPNRKCCFVGMAASQCPIDMPRKFHFDRAQPIPNTHATTQAIHHPSSFEASRGVVLLREILEYTVTGGH